MYIGEDAGLQQVDGLVPQDQQRQQQGGGEDHGHVLLHHAAVGDPLDHQRLQKTDHCGQHQRQTHHQKLPLVGEQVAQRAA